MKVMHLITTLGVGGAENMLLKVLPNLKNENIVYSILDNKDLNKKIGYKLEKKGITVKYLGLRFFNLPKVIFDFRKAIKKEKPDILNTYLIHSNLFGRLFGKLFGVKKVICSVRNKHIDKPLLNFLDRLSSFMVDCYTPNSPAVADFLIKNQKISSKKIKVIANGIEIEKFNINVDKKNKKKELKITNKFIVGCVAKLRKQKGHKFLFKAAQKVIKIYPDIVFLIIGDGIERDNLMNMSKRLKIDKNVLFLYERQDVPQLLQTMDLFVLPTLYEGMSNAILEAMASKCTILTTNIEENKVLITNNKEGILVPPKNSKLLANNLIRLIKNTKLRKELGEKAYKRVVEQYSIKKTIKLYGELYKNEKNKI